MKRFLFWFNLVAIFYLLWNTHCLRAVLLRGEDPSPWRLFMPALVPFGSLILIRIMSTRGNLRLIVAACGVFAAGAGTANAQTEPPKAVVTGVRTWYESGEPVIFDATQSIVDPDARFHWVYSPERQGKLQCELVDNDPKKLRFYTSVGTYTVTLYISSKLGFVKYPFTFSVYANAPEPPLPFVPVPPVPPTPNPNPTPTPPAPNPNPTPTPTPPAPPLPEPSAPVAPVDGKYAIARKVFDQALIVYQKDPARKADIAALVVKLEALREKINPKQRGPSGEELAPQITKASAVLTEVKGIFSTVLMDVLWQVFKAFLSTLLESVFMDNQQGALKINLLTTEMANPGAWADLIDEIAAGLRPLAK